MKYRQGVYAIVVNNEKEVLIVRLDGYGANQWTFPGGGIDNNENTSQAATRELLEETGIQPDELFATFVSTEVVTYDFKKPINFQGTLYKGQTKRQVVFRTYRTSRDSLLLNDEIIEAQWAHLEEIENFLKFPYQYELAVKALAEAGVI